MGEKHDSKDLKMIHLYTLSGSLIGMTIFYSTKNSQTEKPAEVTNEKKHRWKEVHIQTHDKYKG